MNSWQEASHIKCYFSPLLYLDYNLKCVQYNQRGLSGQVSIHHRLLLHLSFSPVRGVISQASASHLTTIKMTRQHFTPWFKFKSRANFSGIDVTNVKNILVDSVCILSPVSDVLPPPNILLAAIGTPFWKSKQITVSINTNLLKPQTKTPTDACKHVHTQAHTHTSQTTYLCGGEPSPDEPQWCQVWPLLVGPSYPETSWMLGCWSSPEPSSPTIRNEREIKYWFNRIQTTGIWSVICTFDT